MTVEFLKMVGHGTTGSDGIEPGIHLKWAFNHKLGFPPCFKLYRRTRELNDRYQFDFSELVGADRDVGYSQGLPGFMFTIESATINGHEVGSIGAEEVSLEDGSQVPAIVLNGELVFSFSRPVSRLELGFLFSPESEFQIIAHSPTGNYSPQEFLGSVSGSRTVAFDAPQTSGLTLKGNGITFGKLRAWICTDKGGWTRIKQECGCGLPINQQKTNYIEDVYPAIMPADLATILCRLDAGTLVQSEFTHQDFLNLKALLLSMLPEGLLVPWGWTLFPVVPNDSTPEENDNELAYSKYDFLLTQSQHVFYARALDLYFVDKDVQKDTYYDYKVTAKWPETNLRQLEHELTFEDYELGNTFFPAGILDDNIVLLAASTPVITAEDFPAARTKQGLLISSATDFTIINFIRPVTEVQISLVNWAFNGRQNEITVEAYRNYLSNYVDKQTLVDERGLLRLRAKQIDSLKIYGSDFVISRLHSDFNPYPVGLQEYIICGLTKEEHYPLEIPSGLQAKLLPGGSVNDSDGNVTENPYVAGLRWDANEDPDIKLLSIAPILHHIERRTESGQFEKIPKGSPVFVTPSVLDKSEVNTPAGWPQKRQYYLDNPQDATTYYYRIAAQDLFGRVSEFTDEETYGLLQTRPPHPLDVTAQFLDYNTYDETTDSFADVTLNSDDQSWLRSHQRKAIVVRWRWTQNLQVQAPAVDGFNVFYKRGWLNSYSGEITHEYEETTLTIALTRAEAARHTIFGTSPVTVSAYEFKTALNLGERVSADAFRLCWLSQGARRFLVLKNTAGNQPTIWVLDQRELVSYTPQKNTGFGVAVTQESVHFIDYTNPQNWQDKSIAHQESRVGTAEMYHAYIEDPAFPDPLIQSTDKEKVRYGQIAVNSQIGTLQGSVSQAAPIMAIYRTPPAAPIAFLPSGVEVEALKATAANVHGKSTFALRWDKPDSALKHHVFRTLDDTLFIVDNQKRLTRSDSVYSSFKADPASYEPADVDTVEQISYESDPKLVSKNYVGLTPRQLQILASLPDNESAFTQLTDKAIDENDIAFADRITEIPHPTNGASYQPDEGVLLYVDETLDGRGSNRYFYALKTLDTNGLAGTLSLATLPVECPRTTPPSAPVLTSVLGGENSITVKWAKNPGADIAGYLLYRTQDKKNAKDWRRMELVKLNDTDNFTIEINGDLPQEVFEYYDQSVQPRQQYYYAVVAVGLSDDGKLLKSKPSVPKSGQAYDTIPPEAPEFITGSWDMNSNNIRLEWKSKTNIICVVKRSQDAGDQYLPVSKNLSTTIFDEIEQSWIFEWEDESVSPGNLYTYFIKAIDDIGLASESLKMDVQS